VKSSHLGATTARIRSNSTALKAYMQSRCYEHHWTCLHDAFTYASSRSCFPCCVPRVRNSSLATSFWLKVKELHDRSDARMSGDRTDDDTLSFREPPGCLSPAALITLFWILIWSPGSIGLQLTTAIAYCVSCSAGVYNHVSGFCVPLRARLVSVGCEL